MKNTILQTLFFLNSLLSVEFSYSQNHWNVTNDSITLSPNRFEGEGSIDIIGEGNTNPHVEGNIIIYLKEKKIVFNDRKNSFQFDKKKLVSLKMNNYGSFAADELFNSDFADYLLKSYREELYFKLDLHTIEFSSSKRKKYETKEGGLLLVNQKLQKGKICYSDHDEIKVLTEQGELKTFTDGDFNFFISNDLKEFSCASIYFKIFQNFSEKLSDAKSNWKETVKKINIDNLISLYGPFESMLKTTTDKTIYVWRKSKPTYYFNTSTFSNTFSNAISSGNSTTNYYYSPLYLYGNVYRNNSLNTMGSSNTSTFQNSKMSIIDEGNILSVTVDANNKIVDVFEENIFSQPLCGRPFRFVNF